MKWVLALDPASAPAKLSMMMLSTKRRAVMVGMNHRRRMVVVPLFPWKLAASLPYQQILGVLRSLELPSRRYDLSPCDMVDAVTVEHSQELM